MLIVLVKELTIKKTPYKIQYFFYLKITQWKCMESCNTHNVAITIHIHAEAIAIIPQF